MKYARVKYNNRQGKLQKELNVQAHQQKMAERQF